MKKVVTLSLIASLVVLMPLAVLAEDITIAFCFQDLETEFWVAGHKAITETLRGQGITVIEKNAHEDANRQLEQVMDAITQGVDGVIIIPQDGESAVTIGQECNDAEVPFAVFNRPPSNKDAKAIVAVADNETIAEGAVEYMAQEAMKLGRKMNPAIMVGDLGDPNAVGRRKGFFNVIEKYPDLFNEVVEIPTKWDANVARANLQSAMQANPEIDFLFTSSDFMLPLIKGVLEPLGKWKKAGEEGHVFLGGLDGDITACKMIRDGYLDGTGVQDVFAEARMVMDEMVAAIERGDKTPEKWMLDPGFSLTRGNFEERAMDMWGCKLLAEQEGNETVFE
jgi:ABC-type sugar transport system substrate-binding protein